MFSAARSNGFLSSSSSEDDEVDALFGSSTRSQRPPKPIVGTKSSFILGDKLGEGAYATVKEGIDQSTLRIVAVKILDLRRLKRVRNSSENIKREVAIQKRLKRHPNLIELIDVIRNGGKPKMYIILEMSTGCTLQTLLDTAPNGKLCESQVASFAYQTLFGLQYMHGRGVVHRDIKPANLMVNVDGTLKISDFGVAEFLNEYNPDDNVSRTSGSPVFQAPEIARGDHDYSGSKVDVWALGVTVYMLLSGKTPFNGETLVSLFQNISVGKFDMLSDVSADCKDVISKFLTISWHDRPTVDEMLKHPWIVQGSSTLSDDAKTELGWRPIPKREFGIMEVVKRMYMFDDDVQTPGSATNSGPRGSDLGRPSPSAQHSTSSFSSDFWNM